MKILAVYPYVPYPLDRGAYHRAFHLLKGLCRDHEVDLIALAENGAGQEHAQVFTEFCRNVRVIPFQHPNWQKLVPDRLRNPLPSTIEHWNIPALDQAIEEVLARETYDAAHVFDIVMARPFLQKFRDIPLVVDRTRVDLQYQLMEQRRMKFSFKTQLLNTENMTKMWRYERWIARHAALQIVCGPDDETFLRKYVTRRQPIEVIANGVDLAYFKPSPTFGSKEPQPTIVFCGAMDYNPNVDGLRWYFAEMHKQIADAMPGLQTWIVGKDPVAEVKAYAKLPGVTVTGGVPDVRPYYQKAWLQIVPIRIGGGTRLKIVESLAMGTPVVSTTMGAQGLDLKHGHDALLADTEFDFIEETLRCLRDTELRNKLVREGQTTVAARLSWDGLGAHLRRIYAERFGRNTPRPRPVAEPALAA
ncbi:MAG TPA: glycosyltransferase [Verrucomicrobiae bacterium]|nr:glycosyltransferase [Verrucomicrobiae bacterium]